MPVLPLQGQPDVLERQPARVACHGLRGLPSGSLRQPGGALCGSLARKSRYGAPLTEHVGTKKPQPELCLQCHQMRRAQLQRSSHMPYREGKVTCTSCHNPHGSPNPSQLIQSTINENCYSCHTERRGPFLWEHPPVMENCANCHEPHGSSNPQLLKVRMPGCATLATSPAAIPRSRSRSVRSRTSTGDAQIAIP